MRDLIYVVVKLQARAGKEEELRRMLEGLVELTRKEQGCRRYVLLRDPRSPAVFSLLEEWETEADLDAHLVLLRKQPEYVRLPEVLGAPLDIGQYKQLA